MTAQGCQAGYLRRLLAASSAALELLSPLTASAGPALTGSATTEACHVWSGARAVTGVSGYIGAAGYIMLFDDVAAPADGTVTATDAGGDWVHSVYVPAAGAWSVWFDGSPLSVKSGLVVCASSTGPTSKTAYSTALFRAQVQ